MFLNQYPHVDYDAIRYLIGQCNYGGRVTDDWDRRALMAILRSYYNVNTLREGNKFSPSGTYYVPPVGTLDVFKAYVQDLPMNDDPEIFGMHNNANIASQLRETQTLMETVLSLQPRASGKGAGRSPDEIIGEMAAEFEAELPPKLDMSEAGPNTFVMKGEHMDSLATVLGQEMQRFNKLLGKMSRSLALLQVEPGGSGALRWLAGPRPNATPNAPAAMAGVHTGDWVVLPL
jgi:dynein heavy chain